MHAQKLLVIAFGGLVGLAQADLTVTVLVTSTLTIPASTVNCDTSSLMMASSSSVDSNIPPAYGSSETSATAGTTPAGETPTVAVTNTTPVSETSTIAVTDTIPVVVPTEPTISVVTGTDTIGSLTASDGVAGVHSTVPTSMTSHSHTTGATPTPSTEVSGASQVQIGSGLLAAMAALMAIMA